MKIWILEDFPEMGSQPETDCQEDRCGWETVDDSFGQSFHRMFDSFFTGKHPLYCPEGRAWNPPMDIIETKDALQIKIEVAGLQDEDIEVKVNKEYLIIRGRRQDEHRRADSRFHLMEIHYGIFERVIRLPHQVEMDKIVATLQNGFLLVRVPRERSRKEYRIEIE